MIPPPPTQKTFSDPQVPHHNRLAGRALERRYKASFKSQNNCYFIVALFNKLNGFFLSGRKNGQPFTSHLVKVMLRPQKYIYYYVVLNL